MTTSPVPIPSPHPLPVASWRLPTGFRGWARLVQAALVVDMLASAVTVGVLFAQRSQLGRFRAGTPIARFTDLAEGERQATVAGGFTLLLVLLTGILWLVWWAKAHRAASERRGDLRYGRGWAIGGWFVPFASFVVPKRVADDLWTAAHEPHHPRDDVIRSGWVLGWWAAWITSSVTSLGIRGGTTASDALAENSVGTIHQIARIVAAVLAIKVVHEISAGFEAQAGDPRRAPRATRTRLAIAGAAVVVLLTAVVVTQAAVGFGPHHEVAAATFETSPFGVPDQQVSIDVPDDWSVTHRSALRPPVVFAAGRLDDRTAATVIETPNTGAMDDVMFKSMLADEFDVVGEIEETTVELPAGRATCFAMTTDNLGDVFDHRLYVLEGSQNVFLVTVTAPADTYAAHAAELDAIVSSFRIDGETVGATVSE